VVGEGTAQDREREAKTRERAGKVPGKTGKVGSWIAFVTICQWRFYVVYLVTNKAQMCCCFIVCQQTSVFFCLTGYWQEVSMNAKTLLSAKPTNIFIVLLCIQAHSYMVPNFQIVNACFSCTPPN
jgi:hypothetical protein